MIRYRFGFLLILFAMTGLGCQESARPPGIIEPAELPEATSVSLEAPMELPAALLSLYKTLNLRSFNSSLGPRLKYHCESYLFEYFPENGVQVDSPTQMTLVNGDDTWVIEILSKNSIRIENIISGPGSYHSSNELSVRPVETTNDVRANLSWIEQDADCKPLNPGKATVLGLRDHRSKETSLGWICGEFWSGRDVTPEMEYWKGLGEIAGKSNPGRHEWGPIDMLAIDVRDHSSLIGQCSGNKQLREVVRIPVFDKPGGNESGTLIRIATFGSGLLGMAGYVSLSDDQAHRVYFDEIRKEQLVLLFSQRSEDWINISASEGIDAWVNVQSFDPETFSTQYLTYLQRVASADEINLLTATPRGVHEQASSNSTIIFTLSDTRTAMTPLAIEGDWMHVKFVPPPDYPLIGCGDDPENYTWVDGWIQWRDGDEWFVTEEHHYGC